MLDKNKIIELEKEVGDLKIRLRRVEEYLMSIPNPADFLRQDDSDDPVLEEVIKLIVNYDTVSASFIQRKCVIGYSRAARILDQLEEKGYIGPVQGQNPRKVLKKS